MRWIKTAPRIRPISPLLLPAILFLSSMHLAEGAQKPPVDPDTQKKIDKAIDRGIACLKGKRIGRVHGKSEYYSDDGNELLLYTLLHGGVSPEDSDYQALLKHVFEKPLTRNYNVALTAMCLQKIDPAKYRSRIYQCARFLVDNVNRNGESAYGQPIDETGDTPTGGGLGTSSGNKGDQGKLQRVRVHQKRVARLGLVADHSNMQYVALGIRACHDAGIDFDKPLIKQMMLAWHVRQQPPSNKTNKGYLEVDPEAAKSPSGGLLKGGTRTTGRITALARGWAYYHHKSSYTTKSGYYGSMTAGAVGALCIYHHILGTDWRRDRAVVDGMYWMAVNFSVTDVPGSEGSIWYYYYLYALERAGMLFGTERIGNHSWYSEGAKVLLEKQAGDGSWGLKEDNREYQTCLAILFLARATQRLQDVATGKRRK